MADNRPAPLIFYTQILRAVHKGEQWCRILILTKITKLFLHFLRRIGFELHIAYAHYIRNPLLLVLIQTPF